MSFKGDIKAIIHNAVQRGIDFGEDRRKEFEKNLVTCVMKKHRKNYSIHFSRNRKPTQFGIKP